MLAQSIEKIQTLQKNRPLFQGIKRGIERETLRTTSQANLAQTPHTKKLGSKLTHPHITTDYAENLLEVITSPHENMDKLLDQLHDIHAFAISCISDEYLWPISMPCRLGGTDSIPIADYGTSNSGRMKMHYRRGLGYRYGRHMQTIAGLHYNFSLPKTFWERWFESIDPHFTHLQDCTNHYYMVLVRNYLRYAWFISYLFGASPAVHESFFNRSDAVPDFLETYPGSFYVAPHACSLRMSEMGYQSHVQRQMGISYNNLNDYTDTLQKATSRSLHAYELITQRYGPQAQLNTNMLQIEAEFYAAIRPKQTFCPGKRPVFTLRHKGIEYIEVRGIDINPYSPLGITKEQMLLLDVFLIFCLLGKTDPFSTSEQATVYANQSHVVIHGREPDCMLLRHDKPIALKQWVSDIFDELENIAKLLDAETHEKAYHDTVLFYRNQLSGSDVLVSAKFLSELQGNGSYLDYAVKLAREHKNYFKQRPLNAEKHKLFVNMAKESIAKQKVIEESDTISYEEYVRRYYEVYC